MRYVVYLLRILLRPCVALLRLRPTATPAKPDNRRVENFTIPMNRTSNRHGEYARTRYPQLALDTHNILVLKSPSNRTLTPQVLYPSLHLRMIWAIKVCHWNIRHYRFSAPEVFPNAKE
jgi:hypothetical protein